MDKSSHDIFGQHNNQSLTMNLAEARKVLWLKSNPRPLGELLQEGYLDQTRLEWAATYAYNPRLKQAAHILLAQPEQTKARPPADERLECLPVQVPNGPFQIGISLEQARVTPWPFQPFKGQLMGKLVETKQISLKDLGYAAENAWEERVRRAAAALMLVRLNQTINDPTPSAGFIQIVAGRRSYAERKKYQLALIQGLILGVIFGGSLSYLIWGFTRLASTKPTLTISEVIKSPVGLLTIATFVGIIGIFSVLFYLLNRFLNGLDKQIDNFRAGQEGEERTKEIILQTLDGSWSLFWNINLPGRNRADLDIVLVGPPGVLALEIKNLTGEYRNIGDRWEYRAGNHWHSQKKSPSRQANNNAGRLGNFLKADGIEQWVTPVVIWANQESQLTVENPSVAVWTLKHLSDELGNVWQDEKVPAATRDLIAKKLTKLCRRQDEVSAGK
ncbi:MAG: nuclease-related domain-containing protein [Anaerolineales bacterium]